MAAVGTERSLLEVLPFIFILITVFLTSGIEAQGRQNADVFDEDEVTSVLETAFRCHDTPGLAVSVVKNGQTIFSKGFGLSDLDRNIPVTEDTVFGLASLSKAFAATLLVKLLHEKTNLTVDSKVRELLGERFKIGDDFRSQEATFVDLMGHRMGIPANNRLRYSPDWTRDKLLDQIWKIPTRNEFRADYIYNNLIYGLVTRIAEIIGEDTWENLVRRHLFQPLGMTKSSFATEIDFDRSDVSYGYQTAFNGTQGEFVKTYPEFSRRWASLAGSGAVMSTASDMVKWMNFHLNGGKDGQGRKVMDEDNLQELHKPRMLTKTSIDTSDSPYPVLETYYGYAHGFKTGYYRGFERLTHTGATAGYRAMISLIPHENIGVFTSMTGDDKGFPYRTSMHAYLLDKALGLSPWLNSSTMCSYPKPWGKKSKSSFYDTPLPLPRSADLYTGVYYNDLYGTSEVTYNNETSFLEMKYGWGRWQLLPKSSSDPSLDNFFGQAVGMTTLHVSSMYFMVEENGGKTSIVGMNLKGCESNMPPTFMKLQEDGDPRGTTDSGVVCLVSLYTLLIALVFNSLL